MGRPRIVNRVVERILRGLAHGTWRPGDSLPPSRALADEFGVSLATVQAAIRRAAHYKLLEVRQRQPVAIRADAAERALRILHRLSARPAARHLAILVPETDMRGDEIADTYWRTVAQNVTSAAKRKDIRATVVRWPLLTQVALAHDLPTRGFGAAVALGVAPEYLISLHEMSRQRFPVLLHDRWIPWLNLPAVTRDAYGAAQRMAEMFIHQGHRNVCMICQLSRTSLLGGRDSIAGWLDYLRDADVLDTCTPPVCYIPPDRDPHPFVCRILGAPDGATGALFVGTAMAERIFQDPRYAHLKVPDDISVIAFGPANQIPQTPWRPALTHSLVDHERMAQCVIEQIEKMLDGEIHPPSIRVPLKIEATASVGRGPFFGKKP